MFELGETQMQILIDLLVKKIKEAIDAKKYPYGWPDEKGVGNKIATGQLYDSIQGGVEYDEEGNPKMVLYYADYFKYVNRGRQIHAKRVPLDNLIEWIRVKGIRGRNKKGKFISNTSLAWAIQTNIFKYGIRETNIYTSGRNDLLEMFDDFPNNLPYNLRDEAQRVFNAVLEDIENFIEDTFDKDLVKIDIPT